MRQMSVETVMRPFSILKKLTPLTITVIYAFTILVWFLFFHPPVKLLMNGPAGSARMIMIQYLAGALLFIGVSAFLLHTLLRRFAAERERVLASLSGERNKFEAIIAALGDGISIQGVDYRVLYQNQVHQSFAGGSRAGEYCYKAYAKSDSVCPDCPVALSFLDGEIHRADRTLTRGMATLHLEIIASPLRDSSGEIIGGIELVRDISARKQAENRLAAHGRYLERLLTVSRDITTTTDLKSLYRKIVSVAKESLGLDYSTLMMLSPDRTKLIIADTLGFPGSMVDTFMLVAGEGLSTYVVRNKRPGMVADFGTEQRFEVPLVVKKEGIASAVCVPMMLENEVFGVLIGHTRARHEFSDEEQALYQTIGNNGAVAIKNSLHLSALHQSEEHYRTLFENAHDMIQGIDPADGKFRFVNPAWLAVLGYSQEELEGLSVFDLLHERDRAEGTRIFREAMAGQSFHGVSLTFAGRDGRVVSTEGTISAQREGGAVTASYGFFHDVTQRKHVEEQLRHAQKMEAVAQLAGGVAHDFNNILTTITGYGSMMLTKTENDSRERFILEQIVFAAKRAAALTRGMLAYSRKQVFDLQPVDLNVIVRDLENLLLRLFGGEVEFRTRMAERDIVILADSGQIDQVLMNVAGNARDAITGPGQFIIETDVVELGAGFLAAHGYGVPGPYARLCMADTGAGMDEKTRSRIFEPFFTTKEVGKGTGLGLAMVYGIVKQHKGFIDVSSEPGKGTTFNIYFPLATAPGRD
jgi:PAS domain S-box-containing protein